jgi:lysophospholipase L1-like esterase
MQSYLQKNIIHCIGDSHASFFSGRNDMQPEWPGRAKNAIPLFRAYRLGPVVAYNLCKTGTTTQGREKLFAVLSGIPEKSIILLCFGEIDCRVHMIRQAELQNRDVLEIANECANRYFSVIKEVHKNFDVIVWNVIPSSRQNKIYDKEFPSYGTSAQRNMATSSFNAILNKLLQAEQVKALSIFDELLDEEGKTNQYYYGDDIHLSQMAMPLAVRKLQLLYPENKFSLFHANILDKLPAAVQFKVFTSMSRLKANMKKLKKRFSENQAHEKYCNIKR